MPTLADLLTPCADGEVTFSFVQESEWQRFATLIGQPEWGEYFRGYQTRRENWEAIVELAAPWLNIRGKREIFDLCQAARVPCGMVQQPADVLANEQLAFRQFFQTLDTPSVGKTVIAPGLPWQSRVQLHARGRSNGARPVRSSTSSPGPQLPLSGQRVLELGGFWAAPRCAAILAELGAEVIKIETIKRPDLRDIIRNEDGTTAIEAKPLFQVINCNKKSFTLNLDTEGGRHLFLDLVKKSDFVVENFRPKTLKRFGLAFDDMALANPELVVVSLSGFGQEGPYEHHSAYGPIVESMSGVRSVLGYVGENRTHLAGVGYSDPVSGAFGALAALVAKRQARTTGAAVHIDYSQVEGLLALVPEVTLEYQILGTSPKPSGNREAGVPPFGVYPCAGEDRWIAIAFRSIHSWPVFCRVLGLGADIHEAYGTVDARRHEAMLLDAIITKATLQEDAYKLAERLQRVGIPASPTHTIKDVLEEKGRFDPGTFIRPLGKSDWRCSYGPVIQVVEPAIRPYEPAPLFGAHNDYVLTDVLGLSLDERLELVRSGVVS
jgi:crotonobetainyl-CoA:carnitine CoA-transferase CaiB-like acyl-CoA transferase